MSWPLVQLGDVAPAKASKHTFAETDDVWTLNLDQIEADTGKVLQKIIAPASEAGSSTHGFDERHVLYSKLRPYLNKVVLPNDKGLATTELVPMLPDADRLERKYLAYYLRSKGFVDWVSAQVAGAKMPRVSMQLFWQHEIPLPPLPEQKRIAAILDKADVIRRKRQQAIQLADDFLRAVFLDMFGDPVINPKGWDVKPLSAGIRSISSGWSASGESRPCSDGEKGVLKISAVTSGVFKPEENKVVPPDRIPDGKKLLFPKKGDLLFSRANTRELVAASCIVSADVEDAFLPDKLWLVEADQELILPEFLHFLLWQPRFKERLTSQATGTSGSMLNISKRKFEETYAIFPDIKVQKKFKDIYWAFQTTNGISTTLKAGVDKLFYSLNQKAFSGQL